MNKPERSRKPSSRSDKRDGEKGKFAGKSGSDQHRGKRKAGAKSPFKKSPYKQKHNPLPVYNDSEELRLNKFIANAGVCVRREADTLISAGVVTVNGKIITELGTRVKRTDVVKCNGETLSLEKLQYVLLNKPKDFSTNPKDDGDRRSVGQLVASACKESIYAVGKVDRNTTGVLLFTNDGDLAKLLTHPKHRSKKIYHVHTDKPVSDQHLELLKSGIELSDGLIRAEEATIVEGKKREVGLEIHTGKYRVVDRLFEKMGYEVKKLDRVIYADLTKKDLPRGKWRHLREEEVLLLKRVAKAGR